MADVIGIKLPNGKVVVKESNQGRLGEQFDSESEFRKCFERINESTGTSVTVQVQEMILG